MIASSLFHFTRKFETLLIIIESGKLRASYNIEEISDFYPKEKYAGIPMVCFCDIPLTFIKEHSKRYGKDGIGLKKDWGLKKWINPILYRTKNFTVNDSLEQIINTSQRRISALEKKENLLETNELNELHELTVIKDKTFMLSAFSKKYESDKINYIDREWRFVPEYAEIPFLKENSENERAQLNKDYHNGEPDYLDFTIDDITYIIVPNKKIAVTLIKRLKKLELSEFVKGRLMQLVVDLESIKEDF